MPDLFNGDPVPANALEVGYDRAAWSAKHNSETVKEIVDAVVNALKATGVEQFAATGYCFGAAPAFYLACTRACHVTAITHPGRISVPEDLEVLSILEHLFDSKGSLGVARVRRNTKNSQRLRC